MLSPAVEPVKLCELSGTYSRQTCYRVDLPWVLIVRHPLPGFCKGDAQGKLCRL